VTLNKIGDVQVAQGDLAGALQSYRQDLEIAERLAAADPGNAGWQADLAASHGKLGQVYAALGDTDEALSMFRAGRAIVAPLAEASGHQLWVGYLQSFDKEIATLEGGDDAPSAAPETPGAPTPRRGLISRLFRRKP